MRLRPVRAVHLGQAEPAADQLALGGGRVVAELGVLVQPVRDVDPEPGHAPVEPEPQDLLERLVHGGVPPVQVGLAGQEVVQVVLAAGLVQRPGRRAGRGQPVVRRPAVRGRVGPHVELPVRRGRVADRLDEPGVRAAGVVRHQVEQHPQAPLGRLGDQPVQVGQGAELRVDAQVVRDVVAPVLVRRRHGGRQPDAVHAEPGQVVQMGGDPVEVPVPVVVGVLPGPDVDLVQGGSVPPAGLGPWRVHGSPGAVWGRGPAHSSPEPALTWPSPCLGPGTGGDWSDEPGYRADRGDPAAHGGGLLPAGQRPGVALGRGAPQVSPVPRAGSR